MITICCLFIFTNAQAQTSQDSLPTIEDVNLLRVTGEYRGIKIVDVLAILRDRYGIQFYFDPDLLPDYPIDIQFTEQLFWRRCKVC